jgi:F0F1-type ATP synthase membrane subunit b/b'
MRRFGRYLVLLSAIALAPVALAQEGGSSGKAEQPNLLPWKWANFIVLAAGLGYLAGKNGGPFFTSRGNKIREDMAAAGDQLREAEARAAEAERKLAGLEADLAAFREEARKEGEAEARRAAERTAAEVAKIQAHAEAEIASAGAAARLELKRYAAHLAVELAKSKIRGGLTPSAQDELVAGFAQDLNLPSRRTGVD